MVVKAMSTCCFTVAIWLMVCYWALLQFVNSVQDFIFGAPLQGGLPVVDGGG